MQTIQIDDQVFDVLQRAAALLVEPSPNRVLRRVLLTDPILGALPEGPWPSPYADLGAPVADPSREEPTLGEPPAAESPTPIPLGSIPPPRVERAPEPPPRLPVWQSLGDAVAPAPSAPPPDTASVSSQAVRLPPGLRQAFDVIHLIVRHHVPRAEAIRRVSDLRRAAGAPAGGPRLTLTSKDFDRMLQQRGRKDFRKVLKSTFPGYNSAIDGFFDELSASTKVSPAIPARPTAEEA